MRFNLEITSTDASTATICRTLRRLGFTRKKLKCDVLRAEYQAEVSLIERVTCSYYRTNQAASSATRCLEENGTALNAGSLLGYFK